jgi:alkylated DNA repair protein (DNA oxidative demethylase)
MEILPGAFHLPGYLDLDRQRDLVALCQSLWRGTPGPYVPTVRGGAKMRIQMLCLGRHWNALTYGYEASRADFDGLPVPPIPAIFLEVARRAANTAGMAIDPDICIMNYYGDEGRLGLHQDKDERPETLAAGIPIVSISLGDTARFLVGGLKRKALTQTILLASGDAFVMGGPSRLRYHGVTKVLRGTAPPGLELTGRFNLTFRQY